MADEEDRPEEDHATSVLRHWETLNEKVGRESPEEIPKIENGGHPTVPLTFKAEIWDEVVCRCIVEGELIEELDCVGDADLRC